MKIRISESMYRKLQAVAFVLVLLPIGYIAYEGFVPEREPGDIEAIAGDRAFQDQRFERALKEYRAALEEDAEHGHALLGKANTLVQLGHFDDAIAAYDRYVAEIDAEFAGVYANRGIAFDHIGEHELALQDYRKAQELDETVDDGPGWLTRFLHMDRDGQPTIGDRADYIENQLALPEDERQLADPERDSEQRSYTQRLE